MSLVHRSLVAVCSLCAALTAAWVQPAGGEDVSSPKWDRYVPEAERGENVAVYFSNGDNEILFNTPPIDSPGVIDEMLDLLKRAYGVKRIYWRATQIDQIIYRSEVRREASHHGAWIDWLDHLFADLGTGDYMMKAARKRGMTVWGVASLFDHGSQPYIEYPNKGMGPFFTENRIRVEHPEWTPIDRAGILHMSGTICFAYPEARAALVAMYVNMVKGKGYEGLSFHLYNENQGPRFDDEFGFNEPIRQEYLNRYGVDILHEEYDKQKLSDLRGEYLTQFFRELRAAFKPLGVKIGVMIDAKHPDEPQRWLAFRDVRLSGRVTVDWRTYAKEGLVDELFVYFNGDPYQTLRMVMSETKRKGLEYSTLASAGFPEGQTDLRDAGVWRTISGQNEQLEYGYTQEQPVKVMDGNDFVAKLSVLSQMGAGTTPVEMDRVLAATADKSILVRRRALRALVSIAERDPSLVTPEVIARVTACLDDPENIVRCTAFNTLAHLGGSESMSALYDAFAKYANPMLHIFPPVPLGAFPDEREGDLALGLAHESPEVRAMLIRTVSSGKARPALWPAIIDNAEDEDWYVRWNVARALEFIYPPEAVDILLKMLDDPHPTVRNMAARNLSKRLASETRWVGGVQQQALVRLTDLFASYGQDASREDAAWGWRGIGVALRAMGPRGRDVLEGFLVQTDDPVLAHRAWHCLYVGEEDFALKVITAEEAEAGYRHHPSKRSGGDAPKQSHAEPLWMPYIVQDFDPAVDAHSDDAPTGKWPDNMTLVAGRDGDGRCLELRNGGDIASVVAAKRTDYRVSSGTLRFAFSVKREDEGAQMAAWATSSNQWGGGLRVMVGPDGVSYFDENDRATLTPVRAPVGKWLRFELTADLDEHQFSIDVIDGDEHHTIADGLTLASQLPYFEFNSLVLLPSGENGSGCLIDNVVYEVHNPFATDENE